MIVNGRRTSRRVGNKRAAIKVAQQIQARLTLGQETGIEKAAPLPTVGEHWERFRDTYLMAAVRRSTLDRYVSIFRTHVLPKFGQMSLDAVSHAMIERFVSNLVVEKRLARATVQTIVRCLCRFFNHAKKHKLILENPATGLSQYYRQTHVVHEEIQPMTDSEVPRFLEAVLKLAPQHFGLFLCAIHTGLRSSELAGLQWRDVDFAGKFLMVRRSFIRGRVERTKTSKVRRVDMSDALARALRAERRGRQERAFKEGKQEITPWVFCNRDGGPVEMNNVKNRFFHRCLERAGLRRIRFHDLRHTFASLLIQNGESLAYVKEQLGHSSIRMTVDVYGHLVPGKNREAVNRLPTPSMGCR